VLPSSSWPAELIKRGFPLQEIEAGQRILPHAIKLEMVQNADGTLAPLTPESTKPTITVYTAAGITATKRYSFRAPPA